VGFEGLTDHEIAWKTEKAKKRALGSKGGGRELYQTIELIIKRGGG